MTRGVCLSQYAVEKLVAGSGWPTPTSRETQKHVAVCGQCLEMVEDALKLEEEFQANVLPLVLPRKHGRWSMVDGRLGRRQWLAGSAVVALAAVVALLVAPGVVQKTQETKWGTEPAGTAGTEPAGPGTAYVGTRGPASMLLYVKRGNDVFRHVPGSTLLVGDTLRVVPVAEGMDYVLLLSRDASGKTQVIYPWDARSSGRLPAPGKPLGGAFQLDEVLGREEFVAVFSKAPLEAQEALEWLEAGGSRVRIGSQRLGGKQVAVALVRFPKVAP